MNTVIFVLEIIGVVAFAVSGVITALKKNMDLLGVIILGFTTALGGGVIRDIILGMTPPAAFTDPTYAIIAIATSCIFFVPQIERVFNNSKLHFNTLLFLMDTVGLAVFTVLGVQTAYSVDPDSSVFSMVFLGTLSGVGGGVLRDVLSGSAPYIFVKHFYATASIIGALACAVMVKLLPEHGYAALAVGAAIVVLLRICAARFHWKLPKHKEKRD